MAQVLKDGIKERILAAALQDFFQYGFKSAGMRGIAEKAKIPTGLIYSYYKNKEALFDAVLSPVLMDWERILGTGDGGRSSMARVETECLECLFEHRLEFIILMDKSDGTKHELERVRLISAVEAYLGFHGKADDDEVFTHIVANNFVDGLLQLMYHYKGMEWALSMLDRLSKMYLWGIGLRNPDIGGNMFTEACLKIAKRPCEIRRRSEEIYGDKEEE